MEKTLSLEGSKKLQKYMPEETKYFIMEDWSIVPNSIWKCYQWPKHRRHKTLTLTEAIDMLPDWFSYDLWDTLYYYIIKKGSWYAVIYYHNSYENELSFNEQVTDIETEWKTLLEAIEKMLLFLDDNNLLWGKTN